MSASPLDGAVYGRIDDLLVEAVGSAWAAFSPATGETALLNDEAAAILEVLNAGAASTAAICANLAADSGVDADSLAEIVESSWPRLIEAGLVRQQRADHAIAQ